MASNLTIRSAVVFKNKSYPSASVALDEYISNYESSRQRIRSKYDHDIDELFLSTPRASGKDARNIQKAVVDSSLLLGKLSLEDRSSLPSPSSSDPYLLRHPSSSTVGTDRLVSQDPFKPSSLSHRVPSGTTVDTDTLLLSSANWRKSSEPPSVPSGTTMRTESLLNTNPTSALLGDTDSVATDFLLDVAARGANRAVNEMKPKPEGSQYLSHSQLDAIKHRISEQLKLADSLRQSIRSLEDSRASKSGYGTMTKAHQKAAEAEDALLHSRLDESRRKLYDYIGVEPLRNSSLPESVVSSYTEGYKPPSWVQALEDESVSAESSIISGNLLDQLRVRHRNQQASDRYKMASTPNRGLPLSKAPKWDFSGTKSTIYMNNTKDNQSSYDRQPRNTRTGSITGALHRSKSAAGRLVGNRNLTEGRQSGKALPSHYNMGPSVNYSKSSSSSGSYGKSGKISFSDTVDNVGQFSTEQGLHSHEIANDKHREFLTNLQKDIEDSKSSIAASAVTDDILMDSIPHALKQRDLAGPHSQPQEIMDSAQSDTIDTISQGTMDRILATPPPELNRLGKPLGVEQSPDTEVILAGDRSWEKLPSFKPIVDISANNFMGTGNSGVTALAGQITAGQPGSMETLKHMLFSLQSMTQPGDHELNESRGGSPDRSPSVGLPAPTVTQGTLGDQSVPLDDSTAELLRKTTALTSDMEDRLAPLLHTMGHKS